VDENNDVLIGSALNDTVRKLHKATYAGPDGKRVYGAVTKGGYGSSEIKSLFAVVRLESIGEQVMLEINSYLRIFDYEVAEDRIAAVRDAIAPLFAHKFSETFTFERHPSGVPMRVYHLHILI
jgi:hypothetical protein